MAAVTGEEHCRQTVTRTAQYIGTFSLDVDVLACKSDSVRDSLTVLKAGYDKGEDILLAISLTGITITSCKHQDVLMTHTLKRISYATCDPASCLFSFMARDPASPPHLQECHTFRLATPDQAEELNTIVGTAFRVAYALQVQRENKTGGRFGGKQGLITSRSAEDLLSYSDQKFARKFSSRRSLASTTSALSLVQTEESSRQSARVTGRINCLDRQQTASPVTCPVYSQVFDMEDQGDLDSMEQDSGISSTSNSTNTHPCRYEHLSMELENLSKAPWYQAEMQRDLAMSVLAKEPLGSFMVRPSETQPGTLALSVRVPNSFHPLGTTHYIITRLENGYQIKGFMKVHPSLTALITHHSIMPELLPVPLNIHRHNPSFSDMDHDYASLQDFTQLMRDLRLGEEEEAVYQ